MDFRTIDDELTHLGHIERCDRFGVGELFGKDRRDTDFVGFDIDIGGND